MAASLSPPLDPADRALLNRIQSDFPICPFPFRQLGQELGLEEQDVLERVRRLKAGGIIRRIGGNFVPGKMGYVSTLCAARVPPHQVEHFAQVVNRYPGVTHNYLRSHPYNIWFTFISPSMEEIRENLRKIASETGVQEILNLPATRVFKIKAHFSL